MLGNLPRSCCHWFVLLYLSECESGCNVRSHTNMESADADWPALRGAICVRPFDGQLMNPTNSDELLVVVRTCGCSRLCALICRRILCVEPV